MSGCAGVAAAATLLITSCSTTADYPSSWGPIVRNAKGCDPISGIYKNIGIRVFKDGPIGKATSTDNIKLSRLLYTGAYYEGDDDPSADWVRIELSGAEIVLTSLHADGETNRRAYALSDGSFSCRDGTLHMEVVKFGVAVLAGAVQTTRQKNLLSHAGDGSLIVERQQAIAGTVLVVIPIAGSDRDWSRFERVDPSSSLFLRAGGNR